MYVGICAKESNQVMCLHLTGNSFHGYGRAYIRTQLGAEPQYPNRKDQDLDNYISQIDMMILMMFSNFYKQRVMPSEIYDFFCNNRTDPDELDVEVNLDYIHNQPCEELEEEIKRIRENNSRARQKKRIEFADNIEIEEVPIKDEQDQYPYPDVDPKVQI